MSDSDIELSMNEEKLYLYFLVRKDLKMGKGKIATQCGHAVQELILNPKCPKFLLEKYLNEGGCPKVCLEIDNLDQLNEIRQSCIKRGFLCYQVIDEGITQIEPDTPTVLGIGPIRKKMAKAIIGSLKLL